MPGRYTLEGSRPGHVAAGVYLAHQVLPLDQDGHGVLVGRSMLGVREIFLNAAREIEQVDKNVHIRFVSSPSLNILNYVLCHRDVEFLADQNRLTQLILQELSATHDLKRPIPDFEFFATSTELALRTYGHVLKEWFEEARLTVSEEEWQSGHLLIFRSVLLHHYFLGARMRRDGQERTLVSELCATWLRSARARWQFLSKRSSSICSRPFLGKHES